MVITRPALQTVENLQQTEMTQAACIASSGNKKRLRFQSKEIVTEGHRGSQISTNIFGLDHKTHDG
jgi:superfamily II RNA helicase